MIRLTPRTLTPNWFAAVMGTGIVANAAAGLPYAVAGLDELAIVVWLIAAALLILLLAAAVVQWRRYPEVARSHHHDPVMAHFYGAVPMAMLTVGNGAMLVGHCVVGMSAAVAIDTVLWSVGTALGLAIAVAIPYFAFTSHEVRDDSAFGGWLMPIVTPMVSAATGPLLLDHLSGTARETMVFACLAMFGLSLMASVMVCAQVWGRLMRHKVGEPTMVPTLWILLGPLGQSATALTVLARHVDQPALRYVALGVGVPILGFAALWFAIAAAITIRTWRDGLPFALTWWSFTFPVGTCVTGLEGVAALTGLPAFGVLAVVAFAFLCVAWTTVATRTVRGQLRAAEEAELSEPVTVSGGVG